MSLRHNRVKALRRHGIKSADVKRVRKEHHRRERRRARLDPECVPEYKRYCGWYW